MHARKATHALTAITAATALTATLTGCNPSADANPTPTIGTCTNCTTAATTLGASTSATDGVDKEAADRAAAEDIWRKFNDLIFTVESLPAADVDAKIDAVATEPLAAQMRQINADYRKNGRAGYGAVVTHIKWTQPINGQDTAVLSDCQDGSQAGIQNAATGEKVTVGTVNTPITGTLVRTSGGWRVKSAALVQGATCTPGV